MMSEFLGSILTSHSPPMCIFFLLLSDLFWSLKTPPPPPPPPPKLRHHLWTLPSRNCGECHLHVLVRACAQQNSRKLQVLPKNLSFAFRNWFYELIFVPAYKFDIECCETSVKNQTYSNKHQNAEY